MQRPLSPHLQVYSPQLTSVLSIFHRITGVFLILFAVFCVALVYYISAGPSSFERFVAFSAHPIVKIMLIGLFCCLSYHFFNGLRYLVWSNGTGLNLKIYYWSGYLVLGLTFIVTLLFGVYCL